MNKRAFFLCLLFVLMVISVHHQLNAQDVTITDFSGWANAGVIQVGNSTTSPGGQPADNLKGPIQVTVDLVSMNDPDGCESIIYDSTNDKLILEAVGNSLTCSNSSAFVRLRFSRPVKKVVMKGNLETSGGDLTTLPNSVVTGTGANTTLTWDNHNQDFVNIQVAAAFTFNINPVLQVRRNIRFTLDQIELEYDRNTYSYEDNLLTPVFVAQDPLPNPFDINNATQDRFNYGEPARDFSILMPIKDLDRGDFNLNVTTSGVFEYRGHRIAGADNVNSNNPFGVSDLYLELQMTWRGNLNGARVETINVESAQANQLNKIINIQVGNATAPGFIWKGLTGWFKANDGPSAVNDGQGIASWTDRSGYSKSLIQPGGSQPLLSVSDGNISNGLEGINLNPSASFLPPQFMQYEDVPISGTVPVDPWSAIANRDLYVFVVYKPNTQTPGTVFGTSQNGSNRGLYSISGSLNTIGGGNNADISSVNGLFEANKTKLASVFYREGLNNGSIIRINGQSVRSFTSNTVSQPFDGFRLGQKGDQSGSGFNGKIAELAVYNESLSETAINQIESYFAMKYGLERPQGFINSNGGVIFDEATYNNNVNAIGRNDEMAFNQTQATSEEDGAFIQIENTGAFGDNEFYFTANNGGAINLTGSNIRSGFVRVERIWKALGTADVNNLRVKFDLNAPALLYDKSLITDYELFISDTEDFSTVSTRQITPTSISNDELVFDVTGGVRRQSFFTLAARVASISGTLYSDTEKMLPIANKKLKATFDAVVAGTNIKLTLNTTTAADGSYLFLTSNLGETIDPTPNGARGMVTNFLVYVDDETEKAITYAKMDNTNGYSNVDLIQNYFTLFGIDPVTTIENANINEGISPVNDTDVTNFLTASNVSNEVTVQNGMSLFIEPNTKYKPSTNISVDGNIYFAGNIDGLGNPTIQFTRNWKPVNDPRDPTTNVGTFIRENTTVELTGTVQTIFGTNTFYRFTKSGTANNQLFFQRGETTRIEEVVILEGASSADLLTIRSVDENGIETPGELAFFDNFIDEATLPSRRIRFLDVKDNRNLDDDLVDPQSSTDSGNNFDWFLPTVQWVVDPTNPFLTEETITEADIDHPVTLKLSSRSSKITSVTIGVSTRSTAVSPSDYVSLSTRTFTWPARAVNLEQTFTVDLELDGVFEGTEQLILFISDVGLVNAEKLPEFEYTLNIIDNDAPPQVTLAVIDPANPTGPRINTTDIYETNDDITAGNPAPTTATIVAQLMAPISVPVTVDLTTSGNAILNEDYFLSDNKIIIRAGETEGEITVFATNDVFFENPENVDIAITSVQNGTEDGVQLATVNILSRDSEPEVTFKTDITSVNETGGTARVFAVLSRPSQVDVSIDIVTMGNATDRIDYDFLDNNGVGSRTLAIPAGNRSSNFLVLDPIEDLDPEITENVVITFGPLTNVSDPAPAESLTIEILDDDADPSRSTVTANPETILGDGNSTSELTVQLFDINGNPLTNSGGTVVVNTNAGTLLTLNPNTTEVVSDFGNGAYLATLQSESTGDNDIIATVTADINGIPISDIALVTFTNSRDTDGDLIPDSCECPDPNNCPDTDQDGTPNYLDTDSDEDGFLDILECNAPSTQPCACLDTDLDGVPDYLESNIADLDCDTLPENVDVDSDNDTKSDFDECGAFRICNDSDGDKILDNYDGDDAVGDPEGGDTDKDSIKDIVECPTLPCVDTDMDGKPDYFDEDSNNNGTNDSEECPGGVCPDCDNDGLNVLQDPDDDNNGIPDVREIEVNNPLLDIDGDGVNAYCDPDDDGDLILDIHECPQGPICPDSDNDGLPDIIDPDSDNDGVSDRSECGGQSPCPDADGDGVPNNLDKDADGDTIPDQLECQGGVDGVCPDDDGDGIPNNLDLDTNGNGIPDKVEGIGDCDLDNKLAFRDDSEVCDDIISKMGVFTPNGDGLNEFWYIENINLFPNNNVKVFNRLGELVFEMSGYNNDDPLRRWDGTVKKSAVKLTTVEVLPSGTYFFIIDLGVENFDPVTGFVMLKK